ncbi:hypothetical protein OSB04_020018 [Centaurea solstitialis]|uniref:Uncharacterized protein n=1 Tax=Centaurea solstitialis TaxID=347529 RepID=A0AA38WCW3_9ASTR|nr:hypothetical protein OSB04_020018 [Centaurea solstitialis]
MNSDCSKLSKFDRFLVSDSFKNLWPFASSLALPRILSDHCSIILDTRLADFEDDSRASRFLLAEDCTTESLRLVTKAL